MKRRGGCAPSRVLSCTVVPTVIIWNTLDLESATSSSPSYNVSCIDVASYPGYFGEGKRAWFAPSAHTRKMTGIRLNFVHVRKISMYSDVTFAMDTQRYVSEAQN